MSHEQTEAVDSSETAEVESAPAKGTLDVSLDDAFSPMSSGRVRRRISSGTLLMGLVVVVAGGSLWTMRIIDRAAAAGPKTDRKLTELFDAALKDGTKKAVVPPNASLLLGTGDATADIKVPLEDLVKNPFVIWREIDDQPEGTPTPTPKDVDVGPTREQLIAEWEALVDTGATSIKILSTMAGVGPEGRTGIANINGHMMREGDLFAVDGSDIEYIVDRIERNEVTVRATNAELGHTRLVIVKVNRKW